jgi:hypothetical protein
MKRVMVVVEVSEGPSDVHPETLRRQLLGLAAGLGAETVESKVYDVRDRDPRPKEARA